MPYQSINSLVQKAESQLTGDQPWAAEATLRHVLVQEPGHFAALYNIGSLDFAARRPDAAQRALSRAARVAPSRLEPWACLATGLAQAERWPACVAAARTALVSRPDDRAMTQLLAEALCFLGLHGDAVRAFNAALCLAPSDSLIRWRLGLALLEDDRIADSIAHLVPALASGTLPATALQQTGIAFYNHGLTEQARDFFDLALAADPGNIGAAWYRMTSLLPQVAESEDDNERQRAAYESALGAIEHACAQNPSALRRLAESPLSLPFYLPYQGRDDRALQERLGRLLCRIMAHHPAAPAPTRPVRHYGSRLRIGIVSGFFRLHSNWKIPIKGWLEGLDRSRVELVGYHTAGAVDSHTGRARELCDAFVQGPLTLSQWVTRIAADRPDLLLYPEIGMDSMCGRLAALRLAPVQCTSWGHPETSGLPTIDYFLSSDLMEGADAQNFYSERLVRLPHLSIDYKPDHLADIDLVGRGDLGLSETDTVYWCCQNLSKYLPRHDDVFARIAHDHAPARFLFLDDPSKRAGNQIFRRRMATAFARLGLDWQRHCRFLPRLTQRRFLGVTRLTDVFLDSIGWSGCNSVFDAVALGVPVLTLPGTLMRSRHAAAILGRLEIDETIARDEDEYVFLAVQLGRDKITRDALRRRMAAARNRIFEDPRPVRALADFFEEAIAAAAIERDLSAA